jgi:uncharacterized protein
MSCWVLVLAGLCSSNATAVEPVQAAGTTVAAFIGVATCSAAAERQPCSTAPTQITAYADFLRLFGGSQRAPSFWTQRDIEAVVQLRLAVYGYFSQGGSRVWILRRESLKRLTTDLALGLKALESIPEIDKIAAPGITDASMQAALLQHAEKTARVALLDGPGGANAKPKTGNTDALGFRSHLPSTRFGALYHPWLSLKDPQTGKAVVAAPSGFMAGLLARSDRVMSVARSPGNARISGVDGWERALTATDVGILASSQIDVPPLASPASSAFPSLTLGSTDFRYLGTSRFVNFINRSIRQSTGWVLTSRNDATTWSALRLSAQSFLNVLWRQGELVRQADAYFVKCDLTTMTQKDVQNGRTLLLYGLAAIKPAEFVVDRVDYQR